MELRHLPRATLEPVAMQARCREHLACTQAGDQRLQTEDARLRVTA